MSDASRPLLVFDGDCGFCRSWVARWRTSIDGHVDVAASQHVAASYPSIPAESFRASVVLIEPDGEALFGAAAVYRALAHAPRRGFAWWAYCKVPGFAAMSEAAYRFVASRRGLATRVTRALWGEHVVPPGERLTAWLFVRLTSAVFVLAFASLAVQLQGLIGRDGILPADYFLAQVAAHYGPERFLLLPTLAWVNASDALLMALCVSGMLASLLALLGIAPRALLLAAWAAYLSLASVGGDFLQFQWDSLLLESGIVAALLSPWALRSRMHDKWRPSRAAVWLGRWLLFRLMFSSAVVKLASGDPTWRQLTALRYHYETQPLAPWPAWYAHHLPGSFQAFSAVVMFAIEGVAPLLFFAPRRVRMLAGGAIVFLQTLIMLTGNYGFFNWLTLALCVLLLDDGVWPRWLRVRAGLARADSTPLETITPGPHRLTTGIAIALAVLGAFPVLASLRVPLGWLGPLPLAYETVSPLRTVNSYGLFAVMTTSRLEIQLEGSDDRVHWREYAFRWKPGDLRRRPAFVPGHMPRLDWQMWFAALDPGRPAYWFVRLVRELLAGSRPVLALLDGDPFHGHPPRYVRALLYRYHFSDAATRRATGAWWTREPAGIYLPPVQMVGGELAPATELEATP